MERVGFQRACGMGDGGGFDWPYRERADGRLLPARSPMPAFGWRAALSFSTRCIRFTKAALFGGALMTLRRSRSSTMGGPTKARPRKAGDTARFSSAAVGRNRNAAPSGSR